MSFICEFRISDAFSSLLGLIELIYVFRVLFELIWRDYFRFLSIKCGNSLFHLGNDVFELKLNAMWLE